VSRCSAVRAGAVGEIGTACQGEDVWHGGKAVSDDDRQRGTGRFGYRTPGRSVSYLAFPIFAVVSVVIIVTAIGSGEPPLAFALLWTAIAVWNGYWFCWQIGNAVEVQGGKMTWKTVLRSRTVDLESVTGARSVFLGWKMLTVDGAHSLLVAGSGRGWVRFVDRMRAETGNDAFEPSVFSRMFSWPEITGGFYEEGS
jgi:hypothetical protein